FFSCFFLNSLLPTDLYSLSLHDALPISAPSWAARLRPPSRRACLPRPARPTRLPCISSSCSRSVPVPHSSCKTNPAVLWVSTTRSEEHTSELQSRFDLVCRLLLEKTKL